MPKKNRAQDLTFILVKPRYPGNIGATARAIKNMGFSNLSVVSPSVLPTHPEARRLAVGAEPLLKKAKVFNTIEEATKGMHFLVGTSRRVGKYRRDFADIRDLKDHLPNEKKVGILFGAEERGLTNKELAFCHLVTTIPSNPRFPSINLAQSVMVVAYQLRIAKTAKVKDKQKKIEMASVEQIEGMYRHLEKTMKEIEFLNDPDSFHIMRTIRQLFGRTNLTAREVRIFRGFCRQVLWRVKNLERDKRS